VHRAQFAGSAPLTVRALIARPDLEVRVRAGRAGLDRPVRWAHVTELADPVRWLRGGELVLTVGLNVGTTEEEQRAYVARLDAAGCAGLGMAVDTWLDEVPPAVLEEAERIGLPLLSVEGSTPFIAIVEAVADHYAAEQLRLQGRMLTAQDAMVRAALRTGPPGVLAELSEVAEGEALLLDQNGLTSHAVPSGERPWHGVVRSAVVLDGERRRGMAVLADGEATVLLQSLRAGGSSLGWLALRCSSPAATHTRMLANHAASLLTMQLLRARDARRLRHRARSPLLHLLATDAAAAAAAARMLPLPTPPLEVVHLATDRPDTLVDQAVDALVEVLGGGPALDRVALCALDDGVLVVLPDGRNRPRLGELLFTELSSRVDGPRSAGACGARGALEVAEAAQRARRTAAAGPGYRHVADTEAWSLLRDSLPEETSREFRRAVLGALREHDARNGTELLDTLRHYLDHNAGVEATARALGVHRNTLRARLRTAERVMGRSLDVPRHRLELWAALALEQDGAPGHRR